MKLQDKTVVVGGGTGAVGEGIVKALLSHGATVIVPARSSEKEEKLRQYVAPVNTGSLATYAYDIGQIDQAEAFREVVLRAFGRIDMVVASLGGWSMGYDLVDTPLAMWNNVLHNNLTTHFGFVKTFIPVLKKQNDGLYININGGAQENIAPLAGAMTIISSAQNRMVEVLHHEAREANYRVRSVAAFTPVRTRARGSAVDSSWVSAEDVGNHIAKLYLGTVKPDPVVYFR
ncbi:SDR family oxidoreductase [Tunicatimonas pelagia]|uniref:SDR family oxidoreductase n=1 Tax=Tunicatimonas pelagia TaxID=931531 RepID=UPI0026655C2C|nr:SDR family oxidoreductase [Tunicatimonas pelagia]WKN45447.1 SDR family NAD(P)-dependent oxidoreductase [Tunicatimonas pelagia]